MRIVRDLSSCPDECSHAVTALGNFDGIHLGHQAILKHCIDFARMEGKKSAAMTFEPHPREFFAPERGALRIYPLRRKIALLREAGIEILFLVRFNARLAATPASSFISDILHRQLEVAHVVTGYDFAFGKGREGTTEALAEAGHKLGFGFTALPAVTNEQEAPISSSAIREALGQGNTQLASQMLGRDYEIEGRVRRGEKRGQTLGFPTANVSLSGLFRPRFGVYAARLGFADGTWHDAVANLGIKPTFGAAEPLLEVHALGVTPNFYGERIRVRLLAFLRDEQKFPSMEALAAQIKADCEHARMLLAERKTA